MNDNQPPLQDITQHLRQFQQPGMSGLEEKPVSESEIMEMHSLLKNFYLPFFNEGRKRFVITNEEDKKLNSHYYVTITPSHIEFETESKTVKENINYNFESKEISLNGNPKGGRFLKTFIEKLERMSADIRSNRAEVYEELEKPNSPQASTD